MSPARLANNFVFFSARFQLAARVTELRASTELPSPRARASDRPVTTCAVATEDWRSSEVTLVSWGTNNVQSKAVRQGGGAIASSDHQKRFFYRGWRRDLP